MIIKADPRSIVRFVGDNFEVLQELYREQLRFGSIEADVYREITRHKGDLLHRRLEQYKLLSEAGGDFRLNQGLEGWIAFLTQEFRPLLPAQLAKYYHSINDVYSLVNTESVKDQSIKVSRLEQLYQEVISFLDNVANNTGALLKKSRALKTNYRRLSFPDRLAATRSLIREYIEPLNKILDLNDEQSMASLLRRVGTEVNLDRLATHPLPVQERYEQLNVLLREVNDRLLHESQIISRELLPMIDRIQQDSEVLNGFMVFLGDPHRRLVPEMGKRHRFQVFSEQTSADLNIYLEQFRVAARRPRVRLGEALNVELPTYFDGDYHRAVLNEAMPVDDFLGWCAERAGDDGGEPATQFLALVGLVFDQSDLYHLDFTDARRTIGLGASHFDLPVINVALLPEPATATSPSV